ncbi:hypothetical protein [uncultured Croceitalea sp.]|uniref:hypothetical protein n=1 Tax=uncultured Croceitalea sp. TaxID=1798908 RepID=UPI0033060F00
MNLVHNCSSCKKTNTFPEKAPDRGKLQMKLDNSEVQVNCKNCGKLEKIHLNKITAIINYTPILIAFVISLIVTAILWLTYGAIGTITMTIPILFWMVESNATNTFNKFLVRRH